MYALRKDGIVMLVTQEEPSAVFLANQVYVLTAFKPEVVEVDYFSAEALTQEQATSVYLMLKWMQRHVSANVDQL